MAGLILNSLLANASFRKCIMKVPKGFTATVSNTVTPQVFRVPTGKGLTVPRPKITNRVDSITGRPLAIKFALAAIIYSGSSIRGEDTTTSRTIRDMAKGYMLGVVCGAGAGTIILPLRLIAGKATELGMKGTGTFSSFGMAAKEFKLTWDAAITNAIRFGDAIGPYIATYTASSVLLEKSELSSDQQKIAAALSSAGNEPLMSVKAETKFTSISFGRDSNFSIHPNRAGILIMTIFRNALSALTNFLPTEFVKNLDKSKEQEIREQLPDVLKDVPLEVIATFTAVFLKEISVLAVTELPRLLLVYNDGKHNVKLQGKDMARLLGNTILGRLLWVPLFASLMMNSVGKMDNLMQNAQRFLAALGK